MRRRTWLGYSQSGVLELAAGQSSSRQCPAARIQHRLNEHAGGGVIVCVCVGRVDLDGAHEGVGEPVATVSMSDRRGRRHLLCGSLVWWASAPDYAGSAPLCSSVTHTKQIRGQAA